MSLASISPVIDSVREPRMRTTKQVQPLVGLLGAKNHVEVIRSTGQLICRLRRSSHLFVVLASLASGPGVATIVWLNRSESNNPLFVITAALILNAIFTGIFLYYVLANPIVRADFSRRELSYSHWRGSSPVWTLSGQEIASFGISRQDYLEEGERFENHILFVTTRKGDSIPICISTDEQLVAALLTDLKGLAAKGS